MPFSFNGIEKCARWNCHWLKQSGADVSFVIRMQVYGVCKNALGFFVSLCYFIFIFKVMLKLKALETPKTLSLSLSPLLKLISHWVCSTEWVISHLIKWRSRALLCRQIASACVSILCCGVALAHREIVVGSQTNETVAQWYFVSISRGGTCNTCKSLHPNLNLRYKNAILIVVSLG